MWGDQSLNNQTRRRGGKFLPLLLIFPHVFCDIAQRMREGERGEGGINLRVDTQVFPKPPLFF